MNKKGRFNTGSKTKKGIYVPANPEKYVGDVNDVVYLSSWELKFMVYCDHKDEILKWGSECFFIPYKMERKNHVTGAIKKSNHKYWPDFYMEIGDDSSPDGIKRIVVEIKPHHETMKPVAPKSFTTKSMKNFEYAIVSYEKNMYKWTKAKEFCDARGFEFMIITEKHLNL